MTRSVRHSPRLAVGGPGGVAAVASGSYDWIVHRRPEPVAFLVSSLAGLGGGDELEATVEVAAGAAATVTGQGFTSLLATEAPARHAWRLEVGERGHLTYLPWATIPFAGSRSRSRVDALVAPSGSLVAWETLAVGRVAMGERLRFEELASSWRVSGGDGVLLDERLALRGADRDLVEAAFGGRTHLGCLYVAGIGESVLSVAFAREAVRSAVDLAGASRPAPDLLVVRALDRSAERLERAFWPLVNEARRAAGVEALAPGDVARRWFRA